jgi:hypothetical protein
VRWGFYIGPAPNGSASIMTHPPDTWTNNTFVGLSFPFSSYHSIGGVQSVLPTIRTLIR